MRHTRYPAIFFCLIFSLAPLFLFSQNKDSISKNDSLRISAFYEKNLNTKNFEKNFFEVDTILNGFQEKEYSYHDHSFYARSATPGAAERDIILQSDHTFDQVSSLKYFRHYFHNNSNAKYYYAPSPYANATYMMGPKHEQLFDILFTRNFGNLANLAIDYYLLYSNGVYLYSKANDNFVSATSNFHSKSKRYLAIVDYFYNRMRVNENGGIYKDSVFTENIEPRRDRIGVNLASAENRVKESGIYFRQFYFPGFYRNKKDTVKGNEKYIAFGRFSYSILFKNNEVIYFDENPESGFYSNIFLDSMATKDSLQTNSMENDIEWSNIRFNRNDSTEQRFLLKIGTRFLKQHIYGAASAFNVSSVIPEASVNINLTPIHIDISGFYVAGGYNRDDYSANAEAVYYFEKGYKYFSIGAAAVSQTPCWFDQVYFSNHFQWIHDFGKIYTKKYQVVYSSKDFSSGIKFFNVKNPVYFDSAAIPAQLQGNNKVLQVRIDKLFRWRKWSLDNDIVYQKVSGTDVIRLPELMSMHSLYYSDNLIKNVLAAQFGAEVNFFSSYFPLAYMPATREFYLQNKYKSSAYPYIDFFMNFKIKRIRIFFKLDHLNSGLMGYDYMMIPHYPMADRALKFGLSWIFYN